MSDARPPGGLNPAEASISLTPPASTRGSETAGPSEETSTDGPTLAKEPAKVAGMFDKVAPGYDKTNTVVSFGLDRGWRKATRHALDLRPGERCLDLAAGTGVSTQELARSGAWAIGCDFSVGMLQAGRFRNVPMVAGDALALPFQDASFDAATIAFGLRNVADVPRALQELARVVRPGGRLVICEFSTPTLAPMRLGHGIYLKKVMPQVAKLTNKDSSAYQYLAESIQDWPDQRALALLIAENGWKKVRWRNLTGGVVALHHAIRP